MKQLHKLTEYQFNTLRDVGLLHEIYPDSPCYYNEIKRFYTCINCHKNNKSNDELKDWFFVPPLDIIGFCSNKCFSEWWNS